MKRMFLVVPILLLVGLTACLKPGRDNIWDPENPDKARISGYAYGITDEPVPYAEVQLMQDTAVVYSTTSGTDGYYEIGEIDPGLYELVAHASHYTSYCRCEPESLPAGTDDTVDIWFHAQHYCFEEEDSGTVQPFGFESPAGTWHVGLDPSGPEHHSAPHVYHGERDASGPALAMLTYSGPDFWLNTKFRVLMSSDTGWTIGVLFRYQDPGNFYFVGITRNGIAVNRMAGGVPYSIGLPVDHWFQVGDWYDLTVEMCGANITVYADGLEIHRTDNHYTSGKAGLLVDYPPPGGPAAVNFDDVYIGR